MNLLNFYCAGVAVKYLRVLGVKILILPKLEPRVLTQAEGFPRFRHIDAVLEA
jgi:hypothetical protein